MLLFYAIVDFYFIYDVAVTFWQQVSVESLIFRWHLRLVDFLFKFKVDITTKYIAGILLTDCPYYFLDKEVTGWFACRCTLMCVVEYR